MDSSEVVVFDWTHQTVVAVMTGELDLANARQLCSSVRGQTEGHVVIVDLSAVEYIEPTALREMLGLSRELAICLVAPARGQPRKMLQLSRIVGVIATYDSLALALDHRP
jgi:anti-anti-sigma regulatory factor